MILFMINTLKLSHVAGFFPTEANCTLQLITLETPPDLFLRGAPWLQDPTSASEEDSKPP